MKKIIPFFLCACFALFSARADVKPADVFGDHMVLQREKPILLWGVAAPNESVRATFLGTSAETRADADGRWRLELPAQPANAVPSVLTLSGADNTVAIQDVLVGEVWLASGQSNMYWPVKNTTNAADEIAKSENQFLRLFYVPRVSADTPQTGVSCAWTPCNPQTVPDFSGVAYYFARALQERLGVPVGIVHASWGGSPVEAWMTMESLRSDPDFEPVLTRYRKIVETYPQRRADYDARMEKWRDTCAKAKAKGAKEPPRPRAAVSPNSQVKLAGPYNGMIAPLLPLRLRGFIWYQGEANAGRAVNYEKLFRKMIAQWRADFKQGDLPFYYVQLANYEAPRPAEENYVWMREYQKNVLDTPHTGMAVVIDAGKADDIHWPNKRIAGERLARLALAKDYGVDTEYSGPVLEKSEVRGDSIVLTFSHADGIFLKGDDENAFQIAGTDKVFHPARARVENGALVVRSEQVSRPVAVRYAWQNAPTAILFNGEGLPAAPFRTDAWERVFLPYALAF